MPRRRQSSSPPTNFVYKFRFKYKPEMDRPKEGKKKRIEHKLHVLLSSCEQTFIFSPLHYTYFIRSICCVRFGYMRSPCLHLPPCNSLHTVHSRTIPLLDDRFLCSSFAFFALLFVKLWMAASFIHYPVIHRLRIYYQYSFNIFFFFFSSHFALAARRACLHVTYSGAARIVAANICYCRLPLHSVNAHKLCCIQYIP